MKQASPLTVLLFLLSFLFGSSLSLQSLYPEARNLRTLGGHDQALPLYQEILKQNPNDVTAATRIAADVNSPQRHSVFGKGASKGDKLRFVELLESFGFRKDAIADLIFANDARLAERAKRSSAPLFLQPLFAGTQPPPPPNCSLGACVQLLLLSVCLPETTCVNLLGSEFVQLLESLGLAFASDWDDGDNNDRLVVPYVHVCPVTVGEKTLFLATDLHPNVLSMTTTGCDDDNESTTTDDNSTEDDGAVMYIGPDSLALIDHWSCSQPVKETDSIVDIGCGSGIQALGLAAQSSGKAKVTCVDINERALRFTKFNFEWNNFEEPTLILGNINSPSGRESKPEATSQPWTELLGQSATYILSNPPFLPLPVEDDTISSRYGLFSSGGSTGEEFFQSLVRISSDILDRKDPDATLAVVSEFMNPNIDFGYRLSSWWNGRDPAQALLFTNEDALDARLYAHRRADSPLEASQWEEHLRREGITCVSPGLLFLKRNPKETASDSHVVEVNQCLVPKTPEGSIWTPTNTNARDFTRYRLSDF